MDSSVDFFERLMTFPRAFSTLFNRTRFSLALLAVSLCLSPATDAETLAVFVQPGGGAVSSHFQSEVLPEIRSWAEGAELDLRVINALDGAPEEVSLTPLVVHVGPRGRSIFQGRYADVGKLEHFVRTSRVVPTDGGTSIRRDVAVLGIGRAKVYAPLKITDLSGELPDGFDQEDFRRRAGEAFQAGLERFVVRPEIAIGPSDRAFYMDVHSFRDGSGRVSLSLDLYSQFHCLDPVFRRFDDPISGSEADLADLFAEAARALEAETLLQLESTSRGDGFDEHQLRELAVAAMASWNDLDLAIPAPQSADAGEHTDVELARSWRLDAQAAPNLIFRFPPPLDRYAGEVEAFDAAFELNTSSEKPSLANATGWVEADAGTVTFGEKGLDKAVHGKLKVEKFPASRFELLRAESGNEPLAFGRTSRMEGVGEFAMLGMEVPLRVDAEVEPIIGDDGRPRLWVRARFGLDIDNPFGLKGPDGPPEASKHLVFFLDFQLEPNR